VLDFSDATFSDFFASELKVNIDDPKYAAHGGSKGKRLRYFLQVCDDATAVRTLTTLWEHRSEYLVRTGGNDPVVNADARYQGLINRLSGGAAPQPAASNATASAVGRRLYVSPVTVPDHGRPLTVADYLGENRPTKSGFAALDECYDASLVAAPGASAEETLGRGVMQALVRYVEQHRYRFAVLDPIRGQTITAARRLRRDFDSSRAALYYPWVLVDDPLAGRRRGRPLALPPSGFICGIYARVDATRGVHKAPANEIIRSARGLEAGITERQQESLNPEGINCLRSFRLRGHRVWGARTVSSDPEWKYVNIRRYLLYLEQSIEQGTQWAVSEPNGEPLWNNVRQATETFLYNEFRTGALQGAKPEEAYFVRCNRTTMTQNDIDNGRLICEIGVAPLKPAEFIIFRIGQKTANAQS